MTRASKRPWPTKTDVNYRPRISIIVPTYNESSIIRLKLENLSRLNYEKKLTEIVVVDSNSSDGTVEIVRQFCEKNPQEKITVLVENKREGKSHALNYALAQCQGEVVIVSDADCFWPSDILEKALPFLADPTVGLIGGPKTLLNSNQTWVTQMEQRYLKSANLLRLGESKAGSTLFFEGGFCAFKKEAIDKFDPYFTGSDDNGSVVGIIEKGYRAMLVPEAAFFTTFSSSLRNKLSLKLRRINQLIRVFAAYCKLLIGGKIKSTKITIVPNAILYLVSPSAFIAFIALSILLVFSFPYVLLLLLLLLIPQFRFYAYQIIENNFLLFVGALGVVAGKTFAIWSKPEDRMFLTEDILAQFNLISGYATKK